MSSSNNEPLLNVVLVEPQIPPNTGNVARLCAATQCTLHLVKPLGFSLSDRYLKRAGLDYWPYVKLLVHDSFQELQNQYKQSRFYFATTKTKRSYLSVNYGVGDFLVFGSETQGLPASLREANQEWTINIPISTQVRSLNLSTAVAMVVGEGLRQIGPV